MIIYCPQCYHANSADAIVCERCGASLALREDESYTDRLVWGLKHPEPTVAPRVAAILGERGDTSAIPALCEAIQAKRGDPLFVEEAARALGSLKAQEAVPLLTETVSRSSIQAGLAAVEALGMIGTAEAKQALAAAAQQEPRDSIRQAAEQRLLK